MLVMVLASGLIKFWHFYWFTLWSADTTPDRIGNNHRFQGFVSTHIHRQDVGELGRMIFADEASTEATGCVRRFVTDPTCGHKGLLSIW
jgi:hypothetical protein